MAYAADAETVPVKPRGSESESANALLAARRLIEFVVWEMRYQDLPDDVREAAEVLAPFHPRPFEPRGLTEGPLTVCGFPRDEETVLERRKCFPHQLGPITRRMMDSCRYVLVQDLP